MKYRLDIVLKTFDFYIKAGFLLLTYSFVFKAGAATFECEKFYRAEFFVADSIATKNPTSRFVALLKNVKENRLNLGVFNVYNFYKELEHPTAQPGLTAGRWVNSGRYLWDISTRIFGRDQFVIWESRKLKSSNAWFKSNNPFTESFFSNGTHIITAGKTHANGGPLRFDIYQAGKEGISKVNEIKINGLNWFGGRSLVFAGFISDWKDAVFFESGPPLATSNSIFDVYRKIIIYDSETNNKREIDLSSGGILPLTESRIEFVGSSKIIFHAGDNYRSNLEIDLVDGSVLETPL